jgi:transposase
MTRILTMNEYIKEAGYITSVECDICGHLKHKFVLVRSKDCDTYMCMECLKVIQEFEGDK